MVTVFCVAALIQYLFGIFPGEQYDFTKRLVWPFVDFVTLKSSSANWAAFFVTPALIISFIQMYHAFKTMKFERWHVVYNTAFFLSAIVLYLTQSYGAFVAVFVAIALYLFRSLKFKHFVIVLIGMALLGGGVYLLQKNTYKYKILTNQVGFKYDNSVEGRWDIYKMNLSMIAAHPLLGVGLNQYQSYFTAFQKDVLGHQYNESQIPPHAHNFFMSFWISLGVLGFLGILILVGGVFWRTRFLPDNPATFVLLAIMVHGLIDSYYWRQEIAYTFWIIIALAYTYRLRNKEG
jgi:O-antigen ligase